MKTKIDSFEAACKAEGIDPTLLPIVDHLPEALRLRQIRNYQLDIINMALNNEGQKTPWVANYDDSNQLKYRPYFYKSESSSGSGWAVGAVDRWDTRTAAGARRDYRTREIAEYAANKFLDYYVDTF
jgi:hypothetical protein